MFSTRREVIRLLKFVKVKQKTRMVKKINFI